MPFRHMRQAPRFASPHFEFAARMMRTSEPPLGLSPAVVEIAPVDEARRLERRLAREHAGLLHDAEYAAQARVGERKIARHDVHGERVLERAPREGAAGAQLRGT